MASPAVLRVGIVGCAEIAIKNTRAIGMASDALTVMAVGSRSLEKAQAFIKQTGLEGKAVALGSYQAVLDLPEVDAVYIPLPTSMHVEWVRKAAQAGKHILLEKPIAMTQSDLDAILEDAAKHGVQLMDGTMWSHNPRAAAMSKSVAELGPPIDVRVTFTFNCDANFAANNIRVKKDLDGQGAVGDLGWYCSRAVLWAFSWEMPESVTAHPGMVHNSEGVVMTSSATLLWPGGRKATLQCSFHQALTQDLLVTGPGGAVRLHDFVIPASEQQSTFVVAKVHGLGLKPMALGTTIEQEEHIVSLPEPQEVLMWREFARCVSAIRAGGQPDHTWVTRSANTQRLVLAWLDSIAAGGATIKL